VVAGRTDRGVSARMQVLSGRLEREVAPGELLERLAVHLPPEVGLHLAAPVAEGFHAAWSATSREYRYRLDPAAAGDRERLREAAALVPGTRDFRVFHFKTSQARPRTVSAVELLASADGVTLRLEAPAFARHMVRMLVGGLSAVARGEVSLDTFRAGLVSQRNFHCPTAPPEPLTLWSVGYPPGLDPFSEVERAAFAWD